MNEKEDIPLRREVKTKRKFLNEVRGGGGPSGGTSEEGHNTRRRNEGVGVTEND